MITRTIKEIEGTSRDVRCPDGGFRSLRFLLGSDNMGFTITRTTVYPTDHWQEWHYKRHLEACFCIAGQGELMVDGQPSIHKVEPGFMYALNKHDKHWFKAQTAVTLICVFNPPLKGQEVHGPDRSY